MKIVVELDIQKGCEDNIPATLEDRIGVLIAAAFGELFDEGYIDMTVVDRNGYIVGDLKVNEALPWLRRSKE